MAQLFTEGTYQNVLEELQVGDSIEGILTFLDNNIPTEIMAAE